MAATGNLFAVSKSTGHCDIKSMEPYQHQEMAQLVAAVNKRNAARIARSAITDCGAKGVGHTFGHSDSLNASHAA